jgi:hypothetical protein
VGFTVGECPTRPATVKRSNFAARSYFQARMEQEHRDAHGSRTENDLVSASHRTIIPPTTRFRAFMKQLTKLLALVLRSVFVFILTSFFGLLCAALYLTVKIQFLPKDDLAHGKTLGELWRDPFVRIAILYIVFVVAGSFTVAQAILFRSKQPGSP